MKNNMVTAIASTASNREAEKKQTVEITRSDGLKENLEYESTQTIRLYTKQRVISIVLSYEFKSVTVSQLLAFYDLFNKERAKRYTLYLKKKYCAQRKWLDVIINEEKVPDIEEQLDLENKIYKVVEDLRKNLLDKKIECNKACKTNAQCDLYCFESYRTLFFIFDRISDRYPDLLVDTEKNGLHNNGIHDDVYSKRRHHKKNGYSELYSLLTGTKKSNFLTNEIAIGTISQSIMCYHNRIILTGDWASVFLMDGEENCGKRAEDENNSGADNKVSFEEDALYLFDYAHTLWYICQKWIYLIPEYLDEIDNLHRKADDADNDVKYKESINMIDKKDKKLHQKIIRVQNSVSEVKDVDLMFYNSEYRKIMQNFYDSLKIVPHISTVESNLTILDSQHQRIKDELAKKISYQIEKQNTNNERLTFAFNIIIGLATGFIFATLWENVDLPPIGQIEKGFPILFLGVIFSFICVIMVTVLIFNWDKIVSLRNKRKEEREKKKKESSGQGAEVSADK